jgi:BASS family bile acid:Na+ symporter
LLLRSVLAVLIIMPVLAVLLVEVLDLRKATEVTLVALAISPIPPLLPNREAKGGGQSSYALGLMMVLAIFAIAAIPLLVLVLESVFDRSFAIAPGTIAGMVIMMVVLPLAAGMALCALLPHIGSRLQEPVRWIATGLLVLAVLLLLVGTWKAIWSAIGSGTAIALAAFVVVGLVVGHLLGGPEQEHSTVLALSTACRHPAIALSVASTSFPSEKFGGIILLYLIINVLVCIPYISWQRRRSTLSPSD